MSPAVLGAGHAAPDFTLPADAGHKVAEVLAAHAHE